MTLCSKSRRECSQCLFCGNVGLIRGFPSGKDFMFEAIDMVKGVSYLPQLMIDFIDCWPNRSLGSKKGCR